MSKDEGEFSAKAKVDEIDMNSLPGRLASYKESMKALKPTPSQEKILHFDAALSVIEGLGASVIRENVLEKDVDNLIEAMHQNKQQCLELTTDPKEQEKLTVNAARVEAALKGFVLPLSLGGPSDNLKNPGLNKETEYSIAMEATKKAIVEIGGKGIPQEKYAQAIIEKTQEILKKDSRNFSPEKLEQFNSLVSQGTQVKKHTFTPPEQTAVSKAASKTVEHFVKTMEKDTDGAKAILVVKSAITKMEQEQKVKFTPERVAQITKALAPTIAKLGPDYIEKNKDSLTQELASSLKKEQSYLSRVFGDYKISDNNLKKIATKIDNAHQPKAFSSSVNVVEEAMYKNKIKDEDIAAKLNKFCKESSMNKEFTVKNIPSIEVMAELRRLDPKKFDKIFNEPPSFKIPTSVIAQIPSSVGKAVQENHKQVDKSDKPFIPPVPEPKGRVH